MLLKEFQKKMQLQLKGLYPKEEIDSFFFQLLEYYTSISRLGLAMHPDAILPKKDELKFSKALFQLKTHKPIQYILGETTFCGLQFKVNESVLIPRPETEELTYRILNKIENKQKPLKILDLCTGSGCIAVSLAKNLKNAAVTAVDISEKALQLALHNSLKNKVNINFQQADVLSKIPNGKFDIIVSNPPYVRNSEKQNIKPNVLDYEPHLALFVEDKSSLIFYQKIFEYAKNHLNHSAKLYLEINQYLAIETKIMAQSYGFKEVQLKKDINNNYRMLCVINEKL